MASETEAKEMVILTQPKSQACHGYPSPGQVTTDGPMDVKNEHQIYVVTSQEQVPAFHSVNFLSSHQGLRIRGKNPCCNVCCLKICCRKKLFIEDKERNHLGQAESPYYCCDCSDYIKTEIPDDTLVMQTIKDCHCGECCCPCFYMCKDVKIMDIMDSSTGKIGSFDYSPKCFRCELFCSGRHVIKDAVGAKRFYINKQKCCQNCCQNCCTYTCYLPLCCFGVLPLCMCGPCFITCPLCQKWILPVKISAMNDDSHVSTVWALYPSWFDQKCRCKKMEYYVDYVRENETAEDKALIFGTALAMDYYDMNVSLINDGGFDPPSYIAE